MAAKITPMITMSAIIVPQSIFHPSWGVAYSLPISAWAGDASARGNSRRAVPYRYLNLLRMVSLL